MTVLTAPLKVICHGNPTLRLASKFGWHPGARYTNLRDLRGFQQIGLIDIDWVNYDFKQHLQAVKATRPLITIARDVTHRRELPRTLDQASELACWADRVVIVPKDSALGEGLADLIPPKFLLGYSVPTRYGSTALPLSSFAGRPVHLLGGRPDVQMRLASSLNVHSLDGNRITYDAQFGDYFTGDRFQPHPTGGYYDCIRDSLTAINALWSTKALSDRLTLALGTPRHVVGVKHLADRHRAELGFVLRPAIEASIRSRELVVALQSRHPIGYVRFHHRLDATTKIYEICVDPTNSRRGVGSLLIQYVVHQAMSLGRRALALKCPSGLPAEGFYSKLGFRKSHDEAGKRRRLGVWQLELQT